VDTDLRDKLLQMTGFRGGKVPFSYLGVPVKPQRYATHECDVLMDKILARIRAWPAKKLTYAHREGSTCEFCVDKHHVILVSNVHTTKGSASQDQPGL